MTRHKVRPVSAACVTVLSAIPIAYSFSSGAPSGYSSGPANGAMFCMECHPFNQGTGSVEVLGAPTRYRAGQTYDLTVRITAPEQDGAGFEISAEGGGGHIGSLLLSDFLHTKYADNLPDDYVTHTSAGVQNSRDTWIGNGGSYDYHLQWLAPETDAGTVTFFTSVNAVVNAEYFVGVRYYRTYAKSLYTVPGDVDGDSDVDLTDHALQVDCLDGPGVALAGGCEFADIDGDGDVDMVDVAKSQAAFTDATATDPPEYVLADAVRGGALYDNWWLVNGAAEPVGDHPLYPAIGQKSGSATFRCTECHGWDYKGRDGAYGVGSEHYTDIFGVFGTTLTPQELFDLLVSPNTAADGHDLPAYGMTPGDLWDVVKMVFEGTVDTDDYIDGTGSFLGDAFNGQFTFESICAKCHGNDGTGFSFHDKEFVGTIANEDPWEFLHNVRYGHPGTPMPSFELLGWPANLASDVGAHAATLPQ